MAELIALPIYGGSRQRRSAARWFGALNESQLLPDSELPPVTASSPDALPPSGRWRERSPEAAARLAACRAVVAVIAERENVLAQNLLASDTVRRLAWSPPSPIDTTTVTAQLIRLDARPWQIALTADALTTALIAAETEPEAASDDVDPTDSEPAG